MTAQDKFSRAMDWLSWIIIAAAVYFACEAVSEKYGVPLWIVIGLVLITVICLIIRFLNKAVGKEDRDRW